MNLILDNPIYRIVGATADTLGVQAYAVGGVVRDHFLHRPCTDIDIVCLGNGIELAQATARSINPDIHVSVFKNFGTASFIYRQGDTLWQIEFVGARRESYRRDSRKPIVEDGTLVKRYSDFEPGHTEFVWEGKTKEWEDIAAASAINAKYGRLVSTITEKEIWSDVIDRMLLGLTPITISLHPDRIIFGGPLGLMLPSYRNILKKRLAASLPANHTLPRLHVAKYHDFSVIYGCYYYAKLKLSGK